LEDNQRHIIYDIDLKEYNPIYLKKPVDIKIIDRSVNNKEGGKDLTRKTEDSSGINMT
jgi:hypothetical protein